MNLRRYALFLIVAILTFVIGVTAAFVVGKVNPFSHRRAGYKGCARLQALPGYKSRFMVYTVYRSDGTILRAYDVDQPSGFERLATPEGELASPPPPVVIKQTPQRIR
jgi:hypothetical protein